MKKLALEELKARKPEVLKEAATHALGNLDFIDGAMLDSLFVTLCAFKEPAEAEEINKGGIGHD